MPKDSYGQRLVCGGSLANFGLFACVFVAAFRSLDYGLNSLTLSEQHIPNSRLVHDLELQLAATTSRPFTAIANVPFVQALQLSDTIRGQSEERQKLVALVEIRNARNTLSSFLSALSAIVDSIVVLDDYSTDGSRIEVMELSSTPLRVTIPPASVELLLNKTGSWIREELFDRNILLRYGRAIGGTHFILPDYDEYLSSNCVIDGSLRRAIFALVPGESLALSWAEAWKSLAVQRVLTSDRSMNFLIRRQTIIFADDGVAEYSMESSGARLLSDDVTSEAQNGTAGRRKSTLHVLRCPRSLCPAPIRYKGSSTPLSSRMTVKTLPACNIVELRFLNTANVLLKAAWYESLGRSLGAQDSVTRGKMMDYLPLGDLSGKNDDEKDVITLERLNSTWWSGYPFFDEIPHVSIEQWRAKDILNWRAMHGDNFLCGLPATSYIALNSLAKAVTYPLATQVMNTDRKGLFVVALDRMAVSVLIAFGGGVAANASPRDGVWTRDPRSKVRGQKVGLRHEEWRTHTSGLVRRAVNMSSISFAYCDAEGVSEAHLAVTLVMLMHELADINFVALVLRDSAAGEVGARFKYAPGGPKQAPWLQSLASRAGGNLRYISAPVGLLGSVAGLSLLDERLFGSRLSYTGDRRRNETAGWDTLIEFAENFHKAGTARRYVSYKIPVARLLFSLNAGRSGSKYVSSLISSTRKRGLVSLHEPACPDNFCSGGGALRMQDTYLSDSYASRQSMKLQMVRRSIAASKEKCEVKSRAFKNDTEMIDANALRRALFEWNGVMGGVKYIFEDFLYAETNPNFKSWIYDVIFDTMPGRGYAVDVIVLRKYIPAVVKSLYNTGYFNDRDGYNWMETSASVNAVFPSLSDRNDSGLDAYDKLTSYLLNAEVLFRILMKRYAGIARFIECRSEDIYTKSGGLSFLRGLNLSVSSAAVGVAGVRSDKYDDVVRTRMRHDSLRKAPTTTVAECERRVSDYMRKCREAGIQLPTNMTHAQPWPGFAYS